MIRTYLLPVVAVLLIGLAAFQVLRAQQETPPPAPPIEPARDPLGRSVAGAGLVEAREENISVGSPLPGVVVELFVTEGQKVQAGDPLFRLDDRQLRAELNLRQAAIAAARADLERLKNEPRPEELPVRAAQVGQAEADVAESQDQSERLRRLYERGAATEQERNTAQFALRSAEERLAQARAEYKLLQAGAWQEDVAVAQAALAQAQAQLDAAQTELDRLTVRALAGGTVLQIKIRPGEFVGAPPGDTLMVLGDLDRLHVRVDIDEYDIPRFEPGATAVAIPRGDPTREIPLSFVRVQPYVIPKRSLTGENTERVDTRVLQVIYAFDPQKEAVYVGQQLDVFIAADGKLATSPSQR
jgi:multidrug resistance efflux pump